MRGHPRWVPNRIDINKVILIVICLCFLLLCGVLEEISGHFALWNTEHIRLATDVIMSFKSRA